MNQDASVRTEIGDTEIVNIQRDVRQGCVLFPVLFNIYSEKNFVIALQYRKVSINFNGVMINNMYEKEKYAV